MVAHQSHHYYALMVLASILILQAAMLLLAHQLLQLNVIMDFALLLKLVAQAHSL